MTQLPNGCRCSKLSIYPRNWHSKTAKISIDWYISYRFYDNRHKKPKQVMVRGMNVFKSIDERKLNTEKFLKEEMTRLFEGYNPFDKTITFPANEQRTTISEALEIAYSKVSVSPVTKKDIKFMMKQIKEAIKNLGFEGLEASKVSRKHIKFILESASRTADRYNKNRSYLMILFSELCELEMVETNPVRDIKKKKTVKRLRQVLSREERISVNDYLQTNHPEFHRFLHIFFHSGARISELLRVVWLDVDLPNQRYKLIIQKGREYKQVWKTIKDIAFPYWSNIMNECQRDQYLFSRGLRPGNKPIQPYQIGKRWYRLVKKKLGIQADFYSLKHLHTTEVVDLLNEVEAAKHNEHASTAMVVGIYDVRKTEREHEKMKRLGNKFA